MALNLIRSALCALVLLAGSATAADFKAGEHYQVIAEQPAAEPVVMEFFSYGCRGCSVFDSGFQQIKHTLGEQADVMYVPVDFGGGFWTPAQDLFLVLEALNRREELHTQAFAYFHAQPKPLNETTVKRFLAEHGIAAETFDKVRKSFAVHVKEKRYDQLTQRYKISETPTVIVNGKYRVLHQALKSDQELVQLVRHLLQNP